jgi:peroxiredoxin Q/BCP
MLEKNTIAPDFCLSTHQETEICLRDLDGVIKILYFYPKDNTPGCTTEACDFTNELAEFQKLNATVIGISPDSPEKHKKFIEKHNLSIILLSDESKEILKSYEAWGLKKNFGKEYEGVIRSTYILDENNNILHSWKNVRVKGHVEAVKKRLVTILNKRD